MALEWWNLAFTAERLVNLVVLVSCRYLTYLRHEFSFNIVIPLIYFKCTLPKQTKKAIFSYLIYFADM